MTYFSQDVGWLGKQVQKEHWVIVLINYDLVTHSVTHRLLKTWISEVCRALYGSSCWYSCWCPLSSVLLVHWQCLISGSVMKKENILLQIDPGFYCTLHLFNYIFVSLKTQLHRSVIAIFNMYWNQVISELSYRYVANKPWKPKRLEISQNSVTVEKSLKSQGLSLLLGGMIKLIIHHAFFSGFEN